MKGLMWRLGFGRESAEKAGSLDRTVSQLDSSRDSWNECDPIEGEAKGLYERIGDGLRYLSNLSKKDLHLFGRKKKLTEEEIKRRKNKFICYVVTSFVSCLAFIEVFRSKLSDYACVTRPGFVVSIINGQQVHTQEKPTFFDKNIRPLIGRYEFDRGEVFFQSWQFNVPRGSGKEMCPYRFRISLNGEEILDVDSNKKYYPYWGKCQYPPNRRDPLFSVDVGKGDKNETDNFTRIISLELEYYSGSNKMFPGNNYLQTQAFWRDGEIRTKTFNIFLRPVQVLSLRKAFNSRELHRRAHYDDVNAQLMEEVEHKKKNPKLKGSNIPIG